jgi:hypothetical protein
MGIQPTILPRPNPKGVGNIEIFKLKTAQWTERMTAKPTTKTTGNLDLPQEVNSELSSLFYC